MQSKLQVPLEILDYILSFLQGDHPSLRCCAEVNQVFSEMVERHLYHQITLDNFVPYPDEGEWKTGKLARLFTVTPRLRSHVRVLEISMASRHWLKWLVAPITNEERIGQILPMLSQITTISLSGKWPWKRLHKTFRNSFARMLIRTVSVENITISETEGFPLPVLNHCKSLKRLSLIKLGKPLLRATGLPTLTNNERLQLVHLDIKDDMEEYSKALPAILTWLSSPYSPRIQHLSSLYIDFPKPEEVQRLQALLQDCSSVLKELYLRTDHDIQSGYSAAYQVVRPPKNTQVLNLLGLRSLRSLSIAGDIHVTDTYERGIREQDLTRYVLRTWIPWFIQLLETFDTPNNLERIVLKITFKIEKNRPLIKPDWQPLAASLTSGLFSSLRRVEIHLKCFDWTGNGLDFPALMSMLYSDIHLSPLIDSGLLLIIKRPHRWV